jgi:ADP-heptose:LPS heptosyltransferase
MSLRRNVLIFHLGALGDFIMTWPLAMAAGRLFAQSRVMYVSHAQKGALAERVLRVESVDVEQGWHQLFSENPQLPDRCIKLLEGAHSVFSFVASREEMWAQNVRRLAPQAELVCLRTKAPDEAPPIHVTEYVLMQLQSHPAMRAAMTQMLRSIRERGVSGVKASEGPVLIHPGSGASRKCWPIERFLELAASLKRSGRAVRFVVGETELEQWSRDRVEQLRNAADVSQPATYLELYELTQSAGAFVGNDTGPTHLAGITGVKTIALFGSDPARWSPIGPQVSIVRGEPIDAIAGEQVLAAISG